MVKLPRLDRAWENPGRVSDICGKFSVVSRSYIIRKGVVCAVPREG